MISKKDQRKNDVFVFLLFIATSSGFSVSLPGSHSPTATSPMEDPVMSNANGPNWRNADLDALARETIDQDMVKTLELMQTMKKFLNWIM